MEIKKGIPVSPGVAISKAIVLDAEDFPVPRRSVARVQIPGELQRLADAIAQSKADLLQLKEQTSSRLGAELAKIFDFHVGMLDDKSLIGRCNEAIKTEMVTAEYACYSVMREEARKFRQLESRLFQDRIKDVWDLERRILSHLIGHARAELGQLSSDAIVIAHDLTPSQTAGLDKEKIKGIATDAGGATSHTAILAHALGIPAIVGLENITLQVNSGDTVIIDANRGQIIVAPDAAQLLEARAEIKRIEKLDASLDQTAQQPAVTRDGLEVHLLANIEFPYEIEASIRKGAEGIGLYRTEFMFLSAEVQPSEEEQYEQYRLAIRNLEGRPITFRTLDLGADKVVSGTTHVSEERNPFLGCRSIRLCLQNLPLFKTQLRAILRASTEGPIKIMFPLISSIMELRQAKMVLSDVMEDLEDQGIAYAQNIPVGIMIEVPSAALQAKRLAQEVDFFSIGTNDLIQYTVAVDRSNERIASLYTGAHPSLIKLIKEVIRWGNRQNIEVSLCGEMAGEPEFTMLLIGMGLSRFSATPPAIPEVKKVIRAVSREDCEKVARKISAFDSDREIRNYLREALRQAAPQVYEDRGRDFH